MENDKSKGLMGEHIDFGARGLNTHNGKFYGIDPLWAKYPGISPYAFVLNNPIINIDKDGKEVYYAADGTYLGKIGDNTQVMRVEAENVENVQLAILSALYSGIGWEKNLQKSLNIANNLSCNTGLKQEELVVRAALYTIRYAETHGERLLGYDALRGDEVQTGTYEEKYKAHPKKEIKPKGFLYGSDAAGAYQILGSTLKDFNNRILKKGNNANNFYPSDQDKLATWKIVLNNGIAPLMNDNTQEFYNKLKGVWTSLPGGSQLPISTADADEFYREGIVKELNSNSDIATPQGQLQNFIEDIKK